MNGIVRKVQLPRWLEGIAELAGVGFEVSRPVFRELYDGPTGAAFQVFPGVFDESRIYYMSEHAGRYYIWQDFDDVLRNSEEARELFSRYG